MGFFLGGSLCITLVTGGQFYTNLLESLIKTQWDGNSESTWTWLLRLLTDLQQYFRWMLVPNHNNLISVMFSLWGCALLNWIVRSSILTWNPVIVFFRPCELQSGNCWHAHNEYESSKISVFWEIIVSIFAPAYARQWAWPCDGRGSTG